MEGVGFVDGAMENSEDNQWKREGHETMTKQSGRIKHQFSRRSFLKTASAVGALGVGLTIPYRWARGQAAGKNEIVAALFAEPKSITPLTRKGLHGAQIGRQLHDTPVNFADPETLKLAPAMCESWKQEDPVTYVFKLREGLQWHKGYGEVTAEDAVFSYQKYFELNARRGAANYIDRTEVRDKYTFVVKLVLPYGGFIPTWGTHSSYSTIHCKKAFEEMGKEEFGRNPIGSGPFELVEWKPGVHIKLKKFDGFRDPTYPKVERLTFQFVSDSFVKVEKLRKGELDWIDAPAFGELPALQKDPNITVLSPTTDEWDYISFNGDLPDSHPLKHPKVREAIGYAIDRNSIVKNVYYGNAAPTDHPFPPGMPGSDHPIKYPHDGDPKKARQLLKEAGYGDGFEVSCFVSHKPELRDQLVVIAAQLGEVGIKVKIEQTDNAGWRARMKEGRDYEMALEDIGMLGPDSDPSVYNFLHSDFKGQYVNFPRYGTDEMDQLLEKGRTSSDPAERNRTYNKVVDVIHRDNPMIYTTFPKNIYCMNSKLKGFKTNRVEWNIGFEALHWAA
jgi:peptide/nickel transport system substrate-binding protein